MSDVGINTPEGFSGCTLRFHGQVFRTMSNHIPQALEMPSLSIRLFGSFEVLIDGIPLGPMRTRKEQWLLGLLILRHHCPIDRVWLASTLWPDSNPPQSLNNLRRRLSILRSALGREANRIVSPSARTIGFCVEGATIDVVDFDAAIVSAESERLAYAISLYHGPLLEDCDELWITPERQHREDAYLNGLEALAADALSVNDVPTAIDCLKRVVLADSLREAARRGLMEAYARCGEHAAAVQVYRELRAALHDEMLGEPSSMTVEVFNRISAEGKSASLSLPVLAIAATTRIPQLRSNLPKPPTDLIGREFEIALVVQKLAESGMVTLCGPGGVGKTRVAIAAAEAISHDFSDGAWFVDMSHLSEPTLVLQTIASVLLASSPAATVTPEALAEGLRQRQMLVVIDNCEHLVTSCAEVIEVLLARCPLLRILATSRRELGVGGEHVILTSPLDIPQDQHVAETESESDLVDASLQFPAVRLFVERARDCDLNFVLTDKNVASVVEVCRKVEGLPLAITLVAARAGVSTPSEMLAQLTHRLDYLVRRGGPKRHRSLRATLEWSEQLLPEEAKRLLGVLAVFRGGWTLNSADAVFNDSGTSNAISTINGLSILRECSLVQTSETPHGKRFRMLEMVREYAVEQMPEHEHDKIQMLHALYFVKLALTNRIELHGLRHTAAMERLNQEQDNLRAALTYLLSRADSNEEAASAALKLCAALVPLWDTHGYLLEGRRWITAALESLSAHRGDTEYIDALCGAALLAGRMSDFNEATRLQCQALEHVNRENDPALVANALIGLANTDIMQGEWPRAEVLLMKALVICRESEVPLEEWRALNSLGILLKDCGRYSEARTFLNESLALCRRIGARSGEAGALHNLAVVERECTNWEVALAHTIASLEINNELEVRNRQAINLFELGRIYHNYHLDSVSGVQYTLQSLKITQEIGDLFMTANCFHTLGDIAFQTGDDIAAHDYFVRACELYIQRGILRPMAYCLLNLGHVVANRGYYIQAARFGATAEALRTRLGCTLVNFAESHAKLGQLLKDRLDMAEFNDLWQAGTAPSPEDACQEARVLLKQPDNGSMGRSLETVWEQ
jgi:predicted ATPase/DNA-binding SARP family transcriptional activator